MSEGYTHGPPFPGDRSASRRDLWGGLDAGAATLSQVFAPLKARSCQFGRKWSIAELLLSDGDIVWLRYWFKNVSEASIRDWMQSGTPSEGSAHPDTPARQMIGALLICAVAEACRREGTEASVWPMVRSILPMSANLRRDLFLRDGQPSQLTREAIAEAAQILSLRNVMDVEGTQQWFLTIKLQFGFTFRGARRNLARWLVNLGQPHAVQYLLGGDELQELKSDSFSSLWRALEQYRRDLIGVKEMRDVLSRNPWILPGWIEELLKEAKARLTTLGTGGESSTEVGVHEEQTIEEKTCPVSSLSLDWQDGARPRLALHLDVESIEGVLGLCEATEADLRIDGLKIARWLLQSDGSWTGPAVVHAEPDRLAAQPNLTPRVVSIASRSGELLLDWDLADSGVLEDVLVFDTRSDRMLEAGFTVLDRTRPYVILCDRNCEINGCEAAEVFQSNGVSRKALRLEPPIDANIRISLGDFVLWQPVRSDATTIKSMSPTLASCGAQIRSLQDRALLRIQGLPEGAEDVRLLIHKTAYDMEPIADEWQTVREVAITPEFAAGQRRTRVQFTAAGTRHCMRPRLALSILGAAMLQHIGDPSAHGVRFESLEPGSQLSRAEGTTYIRLWVPEGRETAVAYEGGYRIGSIRHGKVRLHDFPGHGGELRVHGAGTMYRLGVTCVDTGCVRGYIKPMLGCAAQLVFNEEKEPNQLGSNGYTIYTWAVSKKGRATLCSLPESATSTFSNRLWKIQGCEVPMAMALAWRGSWTGAWWDLDRITDYVETKRDLSEQDFAVIKWLRVPLLHPSFESAARTAILASPRRFIESWTSDLGLPSELEAHGHVSGIDSLVRHFLWADFPLSQVSSLTNWAWSSVEHCPTTGNVMGWARTLRRLSDISPILLRKGIQSISTRDSEATDNVLHVFIRRQLELPLDTSDKAVGNRLLQMRESTALHSGLDQQCVDAVMMAQIASMRHNEWVTPVGARDDLLRVGETHTGRRFLSVVIGLFACRNGKELLRFGAYLGLDGLAVHHRRGEGNGRS